MLAPPTYQVFGPIVVKVAEERPHQRLFPYGVSFELSQHCREPCASRAPRAEDPDEILRPYATGVFAALQKPPYPTALPGDAFVGRGQGLVSLTQLLLGPSQVVDETLLLSPSPPKFI